MVFGGERPAMSVNPEAGMDQGNRVKEERDNGLKC
jgi:hypothetical protein